MSTQEFKVRVSGTDSKGYPKAFIWISVIASSKEDARAKAKSTVTSLGWTCLKA